MAKGFNLQDQEIAREALEGCYWSYRCSPEPKDLLFNDAAVNLSFVNSRNHPAHAKSWQEISRAG